jgi:hypothetical protein
MAETWVIVTTDPSKMIDFAALALHEGWLRSCYRVKDEDRIRTDMSPREFRYRDLFDQDA